MQPGDFSCIIFYVSLEESAEDIVHQLSDGVEILTAYSSVVRRF
jgi:hypothetical protein